MVKINVKGYLVMVKIDVKGYVVMVKIDVSGKCLMAKTSEEDGQGEKMLLGKICGSSKMKETTQYTVNWFKGKLFFLFCITQIISTGFASINWCVTPLAALLCYFVGVSFIGCGSRSIWKENHLHFTFFSILL